MNSAPPSQRRTALVVLGLLAAYWLLIFAATHVPLKKFPSGGISHSDKIAHFVAYAGLAFLLTSAVLVTQPFRWRLLAYVLLATATYGAFDELTQIPVGRTADLQDWIADCVGATIGMSAALAIGTLWNRIRPGSSDVADASSVGSRNDMPTD